MTDRNDEFNSSAYMTPAILKEDHPLTHEATPIGNPTLMSQQFQQATSGDLVQNKSSSDELCGYDDCEGKADFRCKFNYDSKISGCKRRVCKKHIVSNLNWICTECDRRVFFKKVCVNGSRFAIMTLLLVILYIILIIGIKQLMFW